MPTKQCAALCTALEVMQLVPPCRWGSLEKRGQRCKGELIHRNTNCIQLHASVGNWFWLDKRLKHHVVTPRQRKFEELVDMARLSPEPLPVILVGGGAILVGDVSDNMRALAMHWHITVKCL